MFKFNEDDTNLTCSFCGKDQEQVKKLIAGSGVYICNECIELCHEIIEEELKSEKTEVFTEIPKHCSPRRWPGHSMCRLPSPMQQA